MSEELLFEVAMVPFGEPRVKVGSCADYEFRDGRCLWSNGKIEIFPDYFKRIIPHPGMEDHDFCSYCGTDNGLHGALRECHDCWRCSGN